MLTPECHIHTQGRCPSGAKPHAGAVRGLAQLLAGYRERRRPTLGLLRSKPARGGTNGLRDLEKGLIAVGILGDRFRASL